MKYVPTEVAFDIFGIEAIHGKEAFVNALKRGEYIICADDRGTDGNPRLILENVYHYDNGWVEIFRFKDIVSHVIPPLKLVRDKSIWYPLDDWSLFFSGMPHYDVFFISRKNNFLDIKSIPPGRHKLFT